MITESQIKGARLDVNVYTRVVTRLVNADLHRAAHKFLDEHGSAAIVEPRGHGKSTRACIRESWDIGNNPWKATKIISNSDDSAARRITTGHLLLTIC